MSHYSKVYRRMWGDAKFRELSAPPPNARDLWIYLITGPHNGIIPGLFSIGEAALAEALEWPLEDFRKAFAELSSKGMAKADWKARMVWLPNAARHNEPASPNVVIGWGKAFADMPECVLKQEALTGLFATVREMPEGFRKAFRKAFLNPSAKPLPNQEQEQQQEQDQEERSAPADPPATPAALFDHWREVMGAPRAQFDAKRRARVEWALKTYGAATCRRAIDGCRAHPFSMGENDRGTKYNDVTLIFRDADHVEKFVAIADAGTTARPAAAGFVPVDAPDAATLAANLAVKAQVRDLFAGKRQEAAARATQRPATGTEDDHG